MNQDSGQTDPDLLLRDQRTRKPGACRRFAWVLTGALNSVGIDARIVVMANGFDDVSTTHVLTEAWIPELQKWVLVDPTTSTLFLVDGHYASLIELRSALLNGQTRRVTFDRSGSNRVPAPTVTYYTSVARHIFVSGTNPAFLARPFWAFKQVSGASFYHLADTVAPPYPQIEKDLLLGATFITGIFGTVLAGYGGSRLLKARDKLQKQE
jgi:hypothetical protein